jgi:hypothetical protein
VERSANEGEGKEDVGRGPLPPTLEERSCPLPTLHHPPSTLTRETQNRVVKALPNAHGLLFDLNSGGEKRRNELRRKEENREILEAEKREETIVRDEWR